MSFYISTRIYIYIHMATYMSKWIPMYCICIQKEIYIYIYIYTPSRR